MKQIIPRWTKAVPWLTMELYLVINNIIKSDFKIRIKELDENYVIVNENVLTFDYKEYHMPHLENYKFGMWFYHCNETHIEYGSPKYKRRITYNGRYPWMLTVGM